MPRDAFVLKIQRELCHPKYARKVSGLSTNRPQETKYTTVKWYIIIISYPEFSVFLVSKWAPGNLLLILFSYKNISGHEVNKKKYRLRYTWYQRKIQHKTKYSLCRCSAVSRLWFYVLRASISRVFSRSRVFLSANTYPIRAGINLGGKLSLFFRHFSWHFALSLVL